MIRVAHRLSEIAISEKSDDHMDAYGRSAFNRYYYASYLIIRGMLRQLNTDWARTGHSQIPQLLTGRVVKIIRDEHDRQLRLGANPSARSGSMMHEAHLVTSELSQMLLIAYDVRVVADYEPEQRIERDGRVIKLRGHTISEAQGWPRRAEACTKRLIKIWRDLGL